MTLDVTGIAEAIHDGLYVSFHGFAPIRCERVSIHEDLSVTVWVPVVGEVTPIRLEYRDQLLSADEARKMRDDINENTYNPLIRTGADKTAGEVMTRLQVGKTEARHRSGTNREIPTAPTHGFDDIDGEGGEKFERARR